MKKQRRVKHVVRSSTADLEEFKAFLGPLAEDYTDSELRQLRNEMQAMAEILLNFYLSKQRGQASRSIEF